MHTLPQRIRRQTPCVIPSIPRRQLTAHALQHLAHITHQITSEALYTPVRSHHRTSAQNPQAGNLPPPLPPPLHFPLLLAHVHAHTQANIILSPPAKPSRLRVPHLPCTSLVSLHISHSFLSVRRSLRNRRKKTTTKKKGLVQCLTDSSPAPPPVRSHAVQSHAA